MAAPAVNPQVPFSGRISSIAVDPADFLHWLLGVGFGGVWETRDAGTTWVSLTDGAPTLATGAIAFDPTNPRTIYVGTGEPHEGGIWRGGDSQIGRRRPDVDGHRRGKLRARIGQAASHQPRQSA